MPLADRIFGRHGALYDWGRDAAHAYRHDAPQRPGEGRQRPTRTPERSTCPECGLTVDYLTWHWDRRVWICVPCAETPKVIA
jgi:hypothetical protein